MGPPAMQEAPYFSHIDPEHKPPTRFRVFRALPNRLDQAASRLGAPGNWHTNLIEQGLQGLRLMAAWHTVEQLRSALDHGRRKPQALARSPATGLTSQEPMASAA